MKQISVIGSGNPVSKEIEKLAEEVGREIAKANSALICGGMYGIMEAVCKGAKSEGGLTIGILPYGSDKHNPYLDVKIVTHLGHARNILVANSGDAIIVINGALGTLTEICYGIAAGKKITLLEGSGGIVDTIDTLLHITEVKEEIKRFGAKIIKAQSPKEAVKESLG